MTISSSIVACVFVPAVTFFAKPLPSNDMGIHKQAHRLMRGMYEVVVEMG
jgi:hypothetical protein